MKITVASVLLLLFLTQCGYTSRPVANNANTIASTNSNSQAARDDLKGQTVRWEEQGITFTLPPDWHKDESLSQGDIKLGDSINSGLAWRGPRHQKIEFNVTSREQDFPASIEVMLEKEYENNKSNENFGDFHYQEVDGVKGLFYRMGSSDKLNANWLTFRHYKGTAQLVGFNLGGPKPDPELLMMIFKSLKLERD